VVRDKFVQAELSDQTEYENERAAASGLNPDAAAFIDQFTY